MPQRSALVYLGVFSLLLNISVSLRVADSPGLLLALTLPNPGKTPGHPGRAGHPKASDTDLSRGEQARGPKCCALRGLTRVLSPALPRLTAFVWRLFGPLSTAEEAEALEGEGISPRGGHPPG